MATSKYLKIAKERLANKGYKRYEPKDSRGKTDRELSVVNGDYINSFIKDADDFIKASRSEYESAGYDTTATNYDRYKKGSGDLDERAKRIRAYSRLYGSQLDSKDLETINGVLSAWTNNRDVIASEYEDKSALVSSVKDANEYDTVVRDAGYMSKYGDMSRAEREKALSALMVNRAEAGKMVGDDKELDSEIDFLENYSLRHGYATSAEYDEEIRELINRRAEIEDHYVNGETFTAAEQQRDNANIADLSQKIERLEAERDKLKAEEDVLEPYKTFKNSADFIEASKYVSTDKNLSDEEIKALGYKKDKTGEWYKNVGLGGVEYYDPAGDMVYEYINADDTKQNDMMLAEKAEMYAAGNVMYNEDVVKTSRYKTYGEMNDEEVSIYNYLYQQSPEDAKAYLDALSPTLDRRFDEKETQRLAELGYDSSIGSSLISIGTNVEAGLLAPVKAIADALGADSSKLDSSSRVTSSLRQGAGEKWGDVLDVNIPIVDQNLGEFLYGVVMSGADMATALALGKGVGGARAAKATQFIMSSEAASSAIYEAHENGITGSEAALRGIAAGMAEWVTEKYSIESLLGGEGRNILINALKQGGIEATEETASTLLNTAADRLLSTLYGHQNEIEADVTELIKSGMTVKEAESKALADYWKGVASDALAGFFSGAPMGGGSAVIKNYEYNHSEEKALSDKFISDRAKGVEAYLESLGEEGDLSVLSTAIVKEALGDKLNDAERRAYLARDGAHDIVRAVRRGEISAMPSEAKREARTRKLPSSMKWDGKALTVGNTEGEVDRRKSPSIPSGQRVTVSKEGDSYAFSYGEDGTTVKASELDSESLEARVSEMATRQKMSPATVQTVINEYDGRSDIFDYVEEAEYVYSMGKTGVPLREVSTGGGRLTNAAREMLYDDGVMYIEGVNRARDKAYRALSERTEGSVTAGRFDTTSLKGMKLNATQKRNMRFAEGLSKLGFNIRLVNEVKSNKRALGFYNEKTGDIEVNVNGSLKDLRSTVKGQFLSTLSHELTHRMKNTAGSLYTEYRDVVLRGFEEAGELDSMVTREMARLRNTGRYKNMNDGALLEVATDEIIARASENMLKDSDAIERLIAENRTLGEKILEFIGDVAERLKSILKEFEGEESLREEAQLLREMVDTYEEAKAKWSAAFAKSAKNVSAANAAGVAGDVENGGEVMYSEGDRREKLSARNHFVEDKYFKSQMAKWEDLKHGAYVKVGEIGSKHPLHEVGMPTGVLRYDVDKLKRNMSDHGDYLTIELLKAIPEIISNPTAISEYSAENTVSVFGNIFVGNSPMMVGVTIARDRAGNNISKVRTYNTRRDVGNLINDNTVLYLDKNKKRTLNWFQACGIQVPLGGTKFGFIRSISQKNKTVKIESVERSNPTVNEQVLGEGDVLYSEYEDTSMREVLSGALLETAQNDAERELIRRYQEESDGIYELEDKLETVQDELINAMYTSAEYSAETLEMMEKSKILGAEIRKLKENFPATLRRQMNKIREEILTLEDKGKTSEAKELRNELGSLKKRYEASLDLESSVEHEAEREKVRALQEQKSELDRQILEVATVPRAERRNTIEKLKKERRNLIRRINKADSALLELAASKPIKELLSRERKRVRAVQKEAAARVLKKDRERRKTRDMRNTVIKKSRDIISKLVTNSDKTNIKQGWQRTVLDFMNIMTREDGVYVGQELRRMQEAYSRVARRLEKDNSTPILEDTLKYIEDGLKDLGRSLAGKTLAELSFDALNDINTFVTTLNHVMKEEDNIFAAGRKRKVETVGKEAAAELVSMNKTHYGTEGIDKVKTALEKLIVTDNMTPQYFFKRVGGWFKRIYEEDLIQGAQNKVGVLYRDTKKYLEGLIGKGGKYSKMLKSLLKNGSDVSFTTEAGAKFTLDAFQRMYIYAVSKRESRGETNHLLGQGIVTENDARNAAKGESKKDAKGRKAFLKAEEKRIREEMKDSNPADIAQAVIDLYTEEYQSATAKKSIKLTEGDILAITDSLTQRQKDFADELVRYLSETVGEWGNEVSMRQYGIRKFGEDYYIPIVVDTDYVLMDIADITFQKKYGERKLSNISPTKSVTAGANAPLVACNILDVFLDHVSMMANYNAYVPTIDTLNKLVNYKTSETGSVSTILEGVYGKNALEYVRKFVSDLNGAGANTRKSAFAALTSLYRKTRVLASLSVIVQQPTAWFRAAMLLNPRDMLSFRRVPRGDGSELKVYERRLKYAPGVTVMKDMGHFDMSGGRSAKDYLMTPRSEGFKGLNHVMATFRSFSHHSTNFFGYLAEMADRVTWNKIWKACEREVARNSPGLEGKDFYDAVGRRFTEVITYTQVYDSPLTRSQIMRSDNEIDKFETAYMGEPTLTLNMMIDALTSKESNSKTRARAIAVFAVATFANTAVKSLAYALRDDDEDETFLEKYFSEIVQNFTNDINPLTYFPYVKSLWNIVNKYEVTRSDLDLVADLVDSFDKLNNDDTPTLEKYLEVVGTVGEFGGIPAGNLIRDFKAVFVNPSKWTAVDKTTAQGIEYAIAEAMGLKVVDYEGYISSLESGDREAARKIYGEIVDYKVFKAQRKAEAEGKKFDRDEAEDAARSAVQSKLTSTFKDAYIAAYESGDLTEMERIKDILRRSEVYKKSISDICRGWVNDADEDK